MFCTCVWPKSWGLPENAIISDHIGNKRWVYPKDNNVGFLLNAYTIWYFETCSHIYEIYDKISIRSLEQQNMTLKSAQKSHTHDDVIKWRRSPRYWPFVRGIHRSPVNTPHKGQWRGTLMFSLICAWINGWINNHEAGDLRRHRGHCDVIVMCNGVLAFPGQTPQL